MPGLWTFEQMDAHGNWTMSAMRGTYSQALAALVDWVEVSALNGTRPGVRLFRIASRHPDE